MEWSRVQELSLVHRNTDRVWNTQDHIRTSGTVGKRKCGLIDVQLLGAPQPPLR